jgi:hypothetical protein
MKTIHLSMGTVTSRIYLNYELLDTHCYVRIIGLTMDLIKHGYSYRGLLFMIYSLPDKYLVKYTIHNRPKWNKYFEKL